MIIIGKFKTIVSTITLAFMITFIHNISYADDPINYDIGHDFGEVELNAIVTARVSVTNTSGSAATLQSLTLQIGSFFNIKGMPDGNVVPAVGVDGTPGTIGIDIEFMPTNLGSVTNVLEIEYTHNSPSKISAEIHLSGTGIPNESITVNNILGFFDSSVASGALIGNGGAKSDDNLLAYSQKKKKSANEARSAENKLQALRNMLVTAGQLIEGGDVEEACGQLKAVSRKCDGNNLPPDFVIGAAEPNPVPQLGKMLRSLSESLECN